MKRFLTLFLGIALVFSSAKIASAQFEELMKPYEEGTKQPGKLSFHGYGELHYNNPVVEGTGFPEKDLKPTFDFHRLVLGWSYGFNDRLSLHAEIDFEHAAKEIELEFAYLDFLINPAVNIRAGAMLMPVGPLNEFHEPPLFYSVERPYVQKFIIPTTWQEGGFGIFGQPLPGLKYRIYFVEGLNASEFDKNGIKGGRQVLFEDENKAVNFGGVGRVEYNGFPGLAVGASYYSAGAAQGVPDIGSAHVTLWDVDARARVKGFDFTALYARTHISGAEKIMQETCKLIAPPGGGTVTESCTSTPAGVGSEQFGWYVEGAYHVAQLIGTEWDFVPFIRWEKFDTQVGVPEGTRDGATNRRVLTGGVAVYPHPDVAIKADVEQWKNEAATDNDGNRFNLAVTYMF